MSEWISVETGFPGTTDPISVYLPLGYRDQRIWTGCCDEEGRWLINNPDSEIWFHDAQDLVTHWMPLPKAPEDA